MMAKRGRPKLKDSYIVDVARMCREIYFTYPDEERNGVVEVVIPAFAQFGSNVFNNLIFLSNSKCYESVRDKNCDPIFEKVGNVTFKIRDIFKGVCSDYKRDNVQIGDNLYLNYYWRKR